MQENITILEKKAAEAPLYGLPNVLGAQPSLIPRSSATRMLQRFMQRVECANSGVDKLSFRVTRIAIFGSYLTNKTHLGDIDIFFSFEPVCSDGNQRTLHEKKVSIPYFCEGMSPEEVDLRRFLVNGEKQFHLLDFSASIEMKRCTYHILFDSEE